MNDLFLKIPNKIISRGVVILSILAALCVMILASRAVNPDSHSYSNADFASNLNADSDISNISSNIHSNHKNLNNYIQENIPETPETFVPDDKYTPLEIVSGPEIALNNNTADRDPYDEAEYRAIGGMYDQQDQIIIPDRGQDYLQAAQEYCDVFERLHLQASPGSKYKYQFIKCLVEAAPDETKHFREAGEIGENTWAFYLTDIFLPENERAYNWSMAGNTVDYMGNDTSIPEGALESYRCGYITRDADGWRGEIVGTGW